MSAEENYRDALRRKRENFLQKIQHDDGGLSEDPDPTVADDRDVPDPTASDDRDVPALPVNFIECSSDESESQEVPCETVNGNCATQQVPESSPCDGTPSSPYASSEQQVPSATSNFQISFNFNIACPKGVQGSPDVLPQIMSTFFNGFSKKASILPFSEVNASKDGIADFIASGSSTSKAPMSNTSKPGTSTSKAGIVKVNDHGPSTSSAGIDSSDPGPSSSTAEVITICDSGPSTSRATIVNLCKDDDDLFADPLTQEHFSDVLDDAALFKMIRDDSDESDPDDPMPMQPVTTPLMTRKRSLSLKRDTNQNVPMPAKRCTPQDNLRQYLSQFRSTGQSTAPNDRDESSTLTWSLTANGARARRVPSAVPPQGNQTTAAPGNQNAASSNQPVAPAGTPMVVPQQQAQDVIPVPSEDPTVCTVCWSRRIDTILVGCHHLFCQPCILELKRLKQPCPKCRSRFRKFKPIFMG